VLQYPLLSLRSAGVGGLEAREIQVSIVQVVTPQYGDTSTTAHVNGPLTTVLSAISRFCGPPHSPHSGIVEIACRGDFICANKGGEETWVPTPPACNAVAASRHGRTRCEGPRGEYVTTRQAHARDAGQGVARMTAGWRSVI
jgi:hypothetical protein